jgi:hypothetical protein
MPVAKSLYRECFFRPRRCWPCGAINLQHFGAISYAPQGFAEKFVAFGFQPAAGLLPGVLT